MRCPTLANFADNNSAVCFTVSNPFRTTLHCTICHMGIDLYNDVGWTSKQLGSFHCSKELLWNKVFYKKSQAPSFLWQLVCKLCWGRNLKYLTSSHTERERERDWKRKTSESTSLSHNEIIWWKRSLIYK